MSITNPLRKRIARTMFYDYLKPKVGSVLYTKLIGVPLPVFGTPEHTGIYIGDNNIVEVHGSGEIKCVTLDEFLDYDSLIRWGMHAYIMTDEKGNVLADPMAAMRAKAKIGEKIEYNILENNCHMFTTYCVTGNAQNTDSTFLELTWAMKAHFNVKKIDWRVCVNDLEYVPVKDELHQDLYKENKGITKYFVNYVPTTPLIELGKYINYQLIGARCDLEHTYLYIEYTSNEMFGGWYSFDMPVHLVDVTTNTRYEALEILPFARKPALQKVETCRIPRGDTFIGRLKFAAVDPSHELSLVDRVGPIFETIQLKRK